MGASGQGLPRLIEATVAAIGLAMTAPLLAGVGAAVRLSSPGPVFFRQRRVGRGCAVFLLYKFRTMRADNTGSRVTARDDRRVTAIGKILRKTKLDELPELWNIVKGDMSFVGPRPEVPDLVDGADPLWREVLEARPGLTDPMAIHLSQEEEVMAQVNGDRERFYRTTLQPYKLMGHRAYLRRRTWRSDVNVIFKTLATVIAGRASQPSVDEIRDRVETRRGPDV